MNTHDKGQKSDSEEITQDDYSDIVDDSDQKEEKTVYTKEYSAFQKLIKKITRTS